MKIIGKQFKTYIPIESKIENDIQGGTMKYLADKFLYIYDESRVMSFVSDADMTDREKFFGTTPSEVRAMQLSNLKQIIEKDNDPVTIGKYKLNKDGKITMTWNFYRERSNQIVFRGRVLLEGNALKGIFYKNEEPSSPERVYYNVDKPLPDPLIPENDDEIT